MEETRRQELQQGVKKGITGGVEDMVVRTADDSVVMTVKEAAALLRISKGLAYEMVRQGSLPTIRLGRRILVPRSALEQMLNAAGGQSEGSNL